MIFGAVLPQDYALVIARVASTAWQSVAVVTEGVRLGRGGWVVFRDV